MKDKQFKLLILTPLLLLASACTASQSSVITKTETGTAKSETAKRQPVGDRIEGETGATQGDSDDPRVKICKRYESCGCQSYKSCMEQLKDDPTPDEPGILECILKSSCKSLCAGKPDCGGDRPKAAPKRSNCSQIRCSKDSDCPGDCHGGCSDGRCYSF